MNTRFQQFKKGAVIISISSVEVTEIRFPIYTLTKNADILALIVFGCIIFTIVQHTWNSRAILIVMEVFQVLITAGTGVIEGVLQMASESLGVFMRS